MSIINREGSWRLVSHTRRGIEHHMDVHTMDPFIMLWRLVKEELDFYSATASVLGDNITIRIMPKSNKIEVVHSIGNETVTDIYECQPL